MIHTGSLIDGKSIPKRSKDPVLVFGKSVSTTTMQVLVHILAWLLFICLLITFHLFLSPFGPSSLPPPLIYKSGILFVLHIGLFYYNARFAIPKLLFRKKILLFIIAVAAGAITVQIINAELSSYLRLEDKMVIFRLNRPEELITRSRFPAMNIPVQAARPKMIDLFAWLSTFIILGVSTSFTVTQKWFSDAEQQKNLEKERLSSELSQLKSQINPHFFFNTLNNIYALTETNPTNAQAAIYTLSKMMRYMLYETEHNQVLLSKEIECMKHYIELMRLRLTDSIAVEFSYPANAGILKIAPLIFITFVENAFKHGISYHDKSYIFARLSVEGKVLHFIVKNRLLKRVKQKSLEGSGIGLANVRRRLQLLYPNQHTLHIDTSHNEYSVHLTIQLP